LKLFIKIFFVSVGFLYASTSIAQYTGDTADGFSSTIGCIQNLNGATGFIPGPIVGSPIFCAFASEAYSITVAGATPTTTYTWAVPAGSTITSGQGTGSISISFGGVAGNVSVDVTNECTTINVALPVTIGSCQFFVGGDSDGFSNVIGCIQNLNGGSGFIPGPIVGSTTFCAFASEAYMITVGGATPTTTYTWTAPAGSAITSGQGTNSVLITFGGVVGNVSVDVTNECTTINVLLPVTVGSCQFFAGGDNDGFSNVIGCIQNLNGGSGFIPGSIVGSTTFCAFASEAYTITVAGATPTTTYTWSAPIGSTITSGQGTNSVLITFGGVAGNVSVDVTNECSTINVLLPVTVGICQFFAGGDSDGFSNVIGCIQNLNGGSGFIPGPIVGSTTFCAFASEAYSITVGGATPTTTYTWTGPAGSVITSGQGTNSVLISFGGSSGTISVSIANECSTVPVNLAVTLTSCIFYAGGPSDGFAFTVANNTPLPIQLTAFDAVVENSMVTLTWTTASELNNELFFVERSKDGLRFDPILYLDGAGTTNQKRNYRAVDRNPISGVSYYRLGQKDFDGTKTFSKVVAVQVNESSLGIMAVYPNPSQVDSHITIKYTASRDNQLEIQCVDVTGKVLFTESTLLKEGINTIEIKAPSQPGLFIFNFRSQDKIELVRIIAQ